MTCRTGGSRSNAGVVIASPGSHGPMAPPGQLRSGCPMNCAVHTSATEQRLVGCGDDRVHRLTGNVAYHDLDHGHDQIVTHRYVDAAQSPRPSSDAPSAADVRI